MKKHTHANTRNDQVEGGKAASKIRNRILIDHFKRTKETQQKHTESLKGFYLQSA